MVEQRDDAFRRFLERATLDADAPDLAPMPVVAPRRSAGPRLVLAAAAAIVVLVGGVAFARRSSPQRVRTGSPGDVSVESTIVSATATGAATSQPSGTTAASGAGSTVGSTAPGATRPSAPPPSTSQATASTELVTSGAVPTSAPTPQATTIPSGSATTATTATTPRTPLLHLELAAVAPGAANGTTVTPSRGPALTVEQLGTGAITQSPGVAGGRSFVPGGQQRGDYAVITREGADVRSLAPASGHVTIAMVSLGALDERVSPTGRNIHTWYELVSAEGADHVVTGVSLQIDPEIGPYFGVAIQGTHAEYTLTADDRAVFAKGAAVTITLDWQGTMGRLLLNGRTLLTVPLVATPIAWEPTARVSIGGSATYGGGYFSIHDDALLSIDIADTQS